jgi:hypothetical protein
LFVYAGAPFVPVAVKNVVMTQGEVEQMTGLNALRIVVIILRSGLGQIEVERTQCAALQVASNGPSGLGAASFPLQVKPAWNSVIGRQWQSRGRIDECELAAWRGGSSTVRDRRRREACCRWSRAWRRAGY